MSAVQRSRARKPGRPDQDRAGPEPPLAAERSTGARRPALSVVIPARNEADSIRPLIEEIHRALEPLVAFEIVCVDDGSEDNTASELRAARAADPRLRVLSHRRACGQSTAIWSGVAAARGEWIVTLDGDGQNVPGDIPMMLEARDAAGLENLHMIAGIRRRRRDNWLRRVSSRVANGLRRRLLKDGIIDSGCGLKLFRRDAFLALPYFDHMHRFLPALIRRNGGEVIQVPVDHRPRLSGKSSYGIHNRLWTGIADLLGVMWLQRRTKQPIIDNKDES